MFPELLTPGTVSVGMRNVTAARDLLASMGIPLVAEDIGGQHGRSVTLFLADGRFVVRAVGAPELVL
jgi:chemotaxis protein CheD